MPAYPDSKFMVLVIDEDILTRDMITQFLEKEPAGAFIQQSANVFEALE